VYQLHLNKIVFKGNIEDSNNKISTFDKNIGCCTNKQRNSQAPTRAAENIPEKFEMSISYRTIFLKIVLK
jgi:hypothetical protein